MGRGDPEMAKALGIQSLGKAQETLKSELLHKKQELIEKIRGQQALLSNTTKQREDVGVRLYGLQKTLASIHIAVTQTEDVLEARREEHRQAKEELTEIQGIHKDKWNELEAMQDKTENCHGELDNLANMLKQIEAYNEKVKGDIAVNRRATYALEEMISKAEKEKREQDFYIATQQTCLRRYYQRQALCRSQLEAQHRESRMAVAALSEFGIEMQSINTEKKQLTDQWKSALIVLGRCDEALQALVDAADRQKEQEISIRGEKNRYWKEIRHEREMQDIKFALLKKYGAQIKEVSRRIKKQVKKRDSILQKYAAMMVSLEEIERTDQMLKGEREVIEQDYKVIEKAYLKQCQNINDMETKMLTGLSEQITLERSAGQVVQGTLQFRQQIRNEHMMATEIEYELARLRVDTLTVQSYNQNISETLGSLDEEVKQKMSLISKMQGETRQRHSEIDVKTKEIDKLNKQYDKLTANLVDKSATPFENIVANIRYEISIKIRVSSELQKQWLGIQTELVTITTENHSLSARARRVDKDRVILEQRKLRLEKDLGSLTKYMKDVDKNVQMKHAIVTRLNEMIAKNSRMKEILSRDNLLLKKHNDLAIKELQAEAARIEFMKEDCNLEKSDVGREIRELQNHVILWKRKINFEKETQAALLQAIMSPSALLGAMKKEYERLKWQMHSVNLQKEKLIAEVQTRVEIRKTIATKVEASNARKENAPVMDVPESLLTKSCMDMRRTIREINGHLSCTEERMRKLRQQRELELQRKGELDKSLASVHREQEAVSNKLLLARPTKASKLLATAMHHRMVKRQQDLFLSKWKVAIKVDVETDWSEARRKAEMLSDLIRSFQVELPMFYDKLDTLQVQLRLALQI